MARRRNDRKTTHRVKSSFEQARDELFRAIRECGVIGAHEDDQREWMDDTIRFMAERYPDVSPTELTQLSDLGMRFCQPVIPHGTEHTALSREEEANAA